MRRAGGGTEERHQQPQVSGGAGGEGKPTQLGIISQHHNKAKNVLCAVSHAQRSEFCPLQYSQKEDKYEEEIKILTDKLKEVCKAVFLFIFLFFLLFKSLQ